MSIKRYNGNAGLRDEDDSLMVGLMIRRSIRQGVVTVTNTPTPIPASAYSKRVGILIINIGSEVVYIGDSAVTVSDGYPVYPRGQIRFEIEDDVTLYGICAASAELRVLEGS